MEWISIKDEMPPDRKAVLLWLNNDYSDDVLECFFVAFEDWRDVAQIDQFSHWAYINTPFEKETSSKIDELLIANKQLIDTINKQIVSTKRE